MSTEQLVIHVGQGGIQFGNAVWELFCMEHGISPDGESINENSEISMKTFFQESKNGKYCPRVIFLDSEPSVVDEIRSGAYKQLFHPDQLLNGKEDSSSNFARGVFFGGTGILKLFRSRLHIMMEQSDYLESFIIFNSVGGGTGSGVGSLIFKQLVLDFPKVTRIQMPIFCGPSLITGIVEPYNSILHIHSSIDFVNLSFLFDNEALIDMCHNLILIEHPNYTDLNRLLALMVSSITCSLRYETEKHTSLKEITTNLIPYPRIHFPLVRHAPIESKYQSIYSKFTVNEITSNVFDKKYQSLKCDTNRGRYMSIVLNYRGRVSTKEIADALSKQKSNLLNFVEWCPSGYKLGINSQSPSVLPNCEIAPSDKGVTMMCNTTAIKEIWNRLGRKFDLLFEKRAFLHWFLQEGMEENEFGESRLDIQLLEEDYEEIGLNEAEIINKREPVRAFNRNILDSEESVPD